MSLVSVVVVLVVVGILLWLLERFVPMDATIKRIIFAVVIIAVVLWLLSAFGLLSGLNSIRIG